MAASSITHYSRLFFYTSLIGLVFMSISLTFAPQLSFRPSQARLPVSKAASTLPYTLTSHSSATTTMEAQAKPIDDPDPLGENQTTGSYNNNVLSILRFCSVTVLVLILILSASVQLISLLKGRGDDVVGTPSVPTQLMLIPQRASLAAPHPHVAARDIVYLDQSQFQRTNTVADVHVEIDV